MMIGHQLPEEELQQLRDDADALSPDLVDVYRTNETDDEYGGQTQEEELVIAGVKAILENPYGFEQLAASRLSDQVNVAVMVPVGTDISEGDILVVTTQANQRLRVTGVLEPQSYEIQLRVLCVRG